MENDTYKTLATASEEVLYKEKNSKFFGLAFPVNTEDEVKAILEELRKKHHSARHWCYAFQLGTNTVYYRVNDDGEPTNSAGMPIYGQIQSFGVTNVLVVVVRYFGGVKLGVGGLISAYKTAAQMSLESADITEKTIDVHYNVKFGYQHMNKVMRVIKEKNLDIVSQKMEMDCEIIVSTRKKNAPALEEAFSNLYEIVLSKEA